MSDETPVVGTAIPTRGRTRSKCEIRHADSGPCDQYAPHPKRCVCVSKNGYHRKRHDFIVDGREGRRCAWCDALERMVKL